jgi:hypothetical protein
MMWFRAFAGCSQDSCCHAVRIWISIGASPGIADLVGRGIRYGEPPLVDPRSGSAEHELGVAIVKLARAIADAIAEVELGDVLAAGDPRRDAHRQSVDELLIAFRTAVEHLQGR